MMKKTMKRCIATILSLTLILGGMSFFANKEMETVEASDAANQYVWENLTYQAEAPICKTEGYFFGGWYESDHVTPITNPSSGNSYEAKFVPANVLTVKCQVTANTTESTDKTHVRLLTTVDCLDYQEVGFKITYRGKTKDVPFTGVLEMIDADNGAGAYNYSPNIFDLASNYYATVTLQNIGKDYYKELFFIEPYWKTADGTRVNGVSRYMRIEDSYAETRGYINVPVYLNDDAEIGNGTEITIDCKHYAGQNPAAVVSKFWIYIDWEAGNLYDKNGLSVEATVVGNVTQVTVKVTGTDTKMANGLLVNLRFKPKYTLTDLQARNLFEMKGTYGTEDITVLDSLYRNMLARKDVDRSWFNATDKVFVISTVAELKGFQEASTSVSSFKGITVKFASDFDMNPTWTASSTQPDTTWTPIGPGGSDQKTFQGTIDGQNHTISGLYVNGADYAGLVGNLDTGVVKNLTLKNSYITGSKYVGGIAGISTGTVENVKVMDSEIAGGTDTGGILGRIGNAGKVIKAYCDAAITNTTTNATGGIVGKASYVTTTATISDCWYAGKLSGKQYLGGILGSSDKSTITISHCQNTGEIQVTSGGSSQSVGGLVGLINAETGRNVLLEDCLNMCKFTNNGTYSQNTGSVFGQAIGASVVRLLRTYGVNRYEDASGGLYSSGWSAVGYNRISGLTVDSTTISEADFVTLPSILLDEPKIRDSETPSACELSFYVDDSTEYWWVKSASSMGYPRLKSFSDMEFKYLK